jgi:hypothetical protein
LHWGRSRAILDRAMLSRAWVAPLAVVGTVLTAPATLTGESGSDALLYTAYSPRGLEVRAISPEGTGARTIVDLAHVPGIYRVALSPNGETLAAQGNRGISTIRLPDGVTRVVARNAYEFTWSPDSKQIAYRTGDAKAQIDIVRIDDSGRRRLTHGRPAKRTWLPYRSLAWAPNRRRIAFVNWQAYDSCHPPAGDAGGVITIGSRRATVLTQFGQAYDPVWARDSRRLAFVGCQDERCALYLSDSNGRNVKRIDGTTGVDDLLAWTGD